MHIIILPTFLLAPVRDTAFSSAWKENDRSHQRKCDSLDDTANTEQSSLKCSVHSWALKKEEENCPLTIWNGLDISCSGLLIFIYFLLL